MKTQYLIILMGLLVLSAGCKKETKWIDGNGDLVQETRNLEQFTSVNLYGDAHLFFSQGANSRADIFAESNIIPLITTTINTQKVLIIDVKNDECYNANHTPEVTLMSPDCFSFSVYGSGNFEAHGLNLNTFNISMLGSGNTNSSFNAYFFNIESSGSGNANFAGSSTRSSIKLLGSGNIYSKTVTCDTCFILSEGSGDVTLTVISYLNVEIKGSGNVYYTGDPEVNSIITGSGLLIKEGK